MSVHAIESLPWNHINGITTWHELSLSNLNTQETQWYFPCRMNWVKVFHDVISNKLYLYVAIKGTFQYSIIKIVFRHDKNQSDHILVQKKSVHKAWHCILYTICSVVFYTKQWELAGKEEMCLIVCTKNTIHQVTTMLATC